MKLSGLNSKLWIILTIFILSLTEVFCVDKKKFNVEDFGAIADGKTLNTLAIQKAINEASANKGGGIVVFTRGRYLTGYLLLKSNVTLHIEEEAVLLGSTDPRHYEKISVEDGPISPKVDDNSKLALLLAHRAKNIAITGSGTIDGQGRELALTVDSLHHTGEMPDPNYNKWSNRPSETARPKIINFSECEDILVKDITIKNAACWVQTYEICRNLTIEGVTVISRAFWNNDGMDITDCKNVRITHCDVNTADDGICLKSYYQGYYNDSIYIGNCTVRSSASAVKFGTASVGGFKNVTIEHIKVIDTYRSAIAIETVDGGFIENIQVSDIEAVNTGNAIFLRIGHRYGEKPGTLKNISLKNIKVEVPFGRPDEAYDMRGPALPFFHNQFPSPICGIPGQHIENVTLENIEISYPGRASKGMAYIPLWRLDVVPEKIKDYPEYSMFGELPSWGFYVRHVNGISFKNITLKLRDEDYRPAFVFDGVTGITMENIQLPGNQKSEIILKDAENLELDEALKEISRKVE